MDRVPIDFPWGRFDGRLTIQRQSGPDVCLTLFCGVHTRELVAEGRGAGSGDGPSPLVTYLNPEKATVFSKRRGPSSVTTSDPFHLFLLELLLGTPLVPWSPNPRLVVFGYGPYVIHRPWS